jgi:hypothetical protein
MAWDLIEEQDLIAEEHREKGEKKVGRLPTRTSWIGWVTRKALISVYKIFPST